MEWKIPYPIPGEPYPWHAPSRRTAPVPSSQFFIVHEDSTFLDGDYAAFGHVTEGMDVVDKICDDIHAEDNNGTVLAENQPVIESIEVLE